MSHITCHVSHVTCCQPPITKPIARDLPLITPALPTVDWFQIKEALILIVLTFQPIMHFYVLLDLECKEPYIHTLFYKGRQKI